MSKTEMSFSENKKKSLYAIEVKVFWIQIWQKILTCQSPLTTDINAYNKHDHISWLCKQILRVGLNPILVGKNSSIMARNKLIHKLKHCCASNLPQYKQWDTQPVVRGLICVTLYSPFSHIYSHTISVRVFVNYSSMWPGRTVEKWLSLRSRHPWITENPPSRSSIDSSHLKPWTLAPLQEDHCPDDEPEEKVHPHCRLTGTQRFCNTWNTFFRVWIQFCDLRSHLQSAKERCPTEGPLWSTNVTLWLMYQTLYTKANSLYANLTWQ